MKKTFKYNFDYPQRLDKYLKNELPKLSRTNIQKLIENNYVFVDDFLVKPSFQLKLNQIVKIDTKDFKNKKSHLKPEKMKIDILYEDNDILVLNKNSGIVVHPGIGYLEFVGKVAR